MATCYADALDQFLTNCLQEDGELVAWEELQNFVLVRKSELCFCTPHGTSKHVLGGDPAGAMASNLKASEDTAGVELERAIGGDGGESTTTAGIGDRPVAGSNGLRNATKAGSVGSEKDLSIGEDMLRE